MSIEVNIKKHLGNFNLDVAFNTDNEVMALLGASGCGKSMTLKCIAGIEKPDEGRIVLDGNVLFDSEKKINLPPQKRKVGYLFQQFALFPNMTVSQNISCGIREHDKVKDAEIIRNIISVMQLEGKEDLRPHQLSGGQQQRVALARILVNKPDVLMLDEPFSALDSQLRFQLEKAVREVITNFGKSVLIVSHDRDEVFRLSDRIAVVNTGKIETIGTRDEIFANPKTKYGAVMTGCKNISPIEVIGPNKVMALDWGIELETDIDPSKYKYVGIRLHDVYIGEGENTFTGTVSNLIENPFSYTVMFKNAAVAEGDEIGIDLPKDTWRQIGAPQLRVSIPKKSILLLGD